MKDVLLVLQRTRSIQMMFIMAVMACFFTCPAMCAAKVSQPNIIIIMTDDMGFSDLGCYGSEIDTPNLDGLAKEGIRFTQFYNTGRCCPTRASLLTGLYSHQAGVGGMTNDAGPENPGYRGRLMPQCVTIGEVLGANGYRTIQTGKWHVGDKEKTWWPVGRGFDRSFSCPEGGGFYFTPKPGRTIVVGDKVVYDANNITPKGWYSTDAWTDEGLKFVREAVDDKKPFVWYLAHNAPHWPLMAKPEDIAKYRGKYKVGWDAIRKQRYERMVKMGIINGDWKLSPRGQKVPAWDTLSEEDKDVQDLRMATYAAMIDCVDQNVGKIIKTLKDRGVYDNTLILFLQDNGGCAEGGTVGSNKGKGICGTAESFALYGECWANVSDTPFRKYKHWVHEGGAATPLIAHWPAGISEKLNGSLNAEPTHVIDLMATCVDLSGAKYPETFKGNKIVPMEGKSLRAIFEGKPLERNKPIFFEHHGNRAVRKDKWKLVAERGKKWELYDLQADRTELNDLAKSKPDKFRELLGLYNAWGERCFVNNVNKKSKPNIVVILADDMGYGEVQCLNPKRGKIKTPQLDSIAAGGMIFTDGHTGSSVCTPSRYALITGRYAWRTRLQQGIIKGHESESLIAKKRLTLAKMLKKKGYHTAAFGKWHLGMLFDSADDENGLIAVGSKVTDGPIDAGGFDEYHGFCGANKMHLWIDNDKVTAHQKPIETLPRLTAGAVDYINNRKGKGPFFLYVPWNSPHSPVVPSAQWQGKSGLNKHADFVMQTDDSYGQIIKALRDNGMLDNTLVICSTDNGTSEATSKMKDLQKMGHFPSGKLRGAKSDIWDGGHRVPFIAHWPKVIKAGTRNDKLVCLTDIMATVADIVGYKLPPNAAEDSMSFLAALKGEDKHIRTNVIHHSFRGYFAIRQDNYKLAICPNSGGWSSPRPVAETWQELAKNGKPLVQLYDMSKDIGEKKNLAARKPEKVKELRSLLEKQVEDGRSNAGPKQKNDVPVVIDKKPAPRRSKTKKK